MFHYSSKWRDSVLGCLVKFLAFDSKLKHQHIIARKRIYVQLFIKFSKKTKSVEHSVKIKLIKSVTVCLVTFAIMRHDAALRC